MRAREFINETTRKLDFTDPSLTRATYFPGMDQYYRFYRMSLDMAQVGSDGKVEEPSLSQPLQDSPCMTAYTKEEAKMIDVVTKLRGINHKESSAGDSKELQGTNTKSPVAKFKPTKRPSQRD